MTEDALPGGWGETLDDLATRRAAARAMGARGVKVEDDAGVEAALRQALVADRPTVIRLAMDRRWEGVDSRP